MRLLSPDCYGHLRRSVFTARNFPRVPVLDPYLNPPEGGVWIWPPLFDLLIGGVARAAWGRGVTVPEVTLVAAALPPLLGALHLFPLHALALHALSRRRARIAVAAYAVIPSAVIWSSFGHADHHVAEGLTLLFVLAAAAALCRSEPAPSLRGLFLFGLSIAAAVMTWQGAVFVAGIGFLFAALIWPVAAPVAALSATLLLTLGTLATLGGAVVPFSFVSFGWFQPLLLAGGTLALSLNASLRARRVRPRLAALVCSALLTLLVLPYTGRVAGAIVRGGAYMVTGATNQGRDDFADGGYLSYPADFLRIVAEAQPLFRAPLGVTFPHALAELSPALLLIPWALFLWLRPVLSRRSLCGSGRAAARFLIFLFGSAILVMTLFQQRNVYYLAIFVSLALAEAIARLRFRRRFLGHVAAPALALALVVLPGFSLLRRVARYIDAPGHDIFDILERLKVLDPPPVDPAALPLPRNGSVASVMAPWSAGHFVTAVAGRPAAADPLVYGWRRQCRLFSTPDEREALSILKEARCRYLLTTDLSRVLPAYAAAAGRPGEALGAMFGTRIHNSSALHPAPFLTRVLDSRTATRAADGTLVPRFRILRVEGVEDEPVSPSPAPSRP